MAERPGQRIAQIEAGQQRVFFGAETASALQQVGPAVPGAGQRLGPAPPGDRGVVP